jgi:CheY-like chemotaxis protein
MATPVLVVDDDTDLRVSLRHAFEYEGYTVYEAPDGAPALEQLRDHPEGMVVLLDLQMPGLDGIQLMEVIQSREPLATRHAYIVMTALHDCLPREFAHRLASLGIPLIAKPFDLKRLLDAVNIAARGLGTSA